MVGNARPKPVRSPGKHTGGPAYFTDEKAVGCRMVFLMEATIGPSRSLSARAANHSGSAMNAPIFCSRSASDSHARRS